MSITHTAADVHRHGAGRELEVGDPDLDAVAAGGASGLRRGRDGNVKLTDAELARPQYDLRPLIFLHSGM